jgi:hypothetical protein
MPARNGFGRDRPLERKASLRLDLLRDPGDRRREDTLLRSGRRWRRRLAQRIDRG